MNVRDPIGCQCEPRLGGLGDTFSVDDRMGVSGQARWGEQPIELRPAGEGASEQQLASLEVNGPVEVAAQIERGSAGIEGARWHSPRDGGGCPPRRPASGCRR